MPPKTAGAALSVSVDWAAVPEAVPEVSEASSVESASSVAVASSVESASSVERVAASVTVAEAEARVTEESTAAAVELSSLSLLAPPVARGVPSSVFQ